MAAMFQISEFRTASEPERLWASERKEEREGIFDLLLPNQVRHWMANVMDNMLLSGESLVGLIQNWKGALTLSIILLSHLMTPLTVRRLPIPRGLHRPPQGTVS